MSLKILVVDDSATARAALRFALEQDGECEVIGELASGADVPAAIRRLRPDLVTMDVFLDGENGLDVASRVMQQEPCPILVVTAADPENPDLVYRTLQAGALDVVAKLPSPQHEQYAARRRRLMRLVRTLADVPLVRRRAGMMSSIPVRNSPSTEQLNALSIGVLAIGASTGGPPVIVDFLKALPPPFPIPIVIVQHLMNGFSGSFAAWISDCTPYRAQMVSSAESLVPGVVYLACDDRHLKVIAGRRVTVSDAPPRSHQRPSVDILFESVAERYGAGAIGMLLTGMGSDGAEGMAALHRAGALTLAQKPSSCAVDGMPSSAIKLGVVAYQDSPRGLARCVAEACKNPRRISLLP